MQAWWAPLTIKGASRFAGKIAVGVWGYYVAAHKSWRELEGCRSACSTSTLFLMADAGFSVQGIYAVECSIHLFYLSTAIVQAALGCIL